MNHIAAQKIFSLKPDADTALKRLEAFWAGESLGRPAVGITVPAADAQTDPFPPSCEGQGPKELDFNPDWHVWFGKFLNRKNVFLGEAMPVQHLGIGAYLALPCVLVGGDYESEKGHGAWIREMKDVYERPLPVFDPEHPVVKILDEAWDRGTPNMDGVGCLSQPFVLEGSTLLSLFRGMDTFLLDLGDQPETVLKWCDALREVNLGFMRHWHDRVAASGRPQINRVFWGPTAQGKADFVQCDLGVMISPGDFAKFVMPYLEKTTEYLDYSLYHLDGMAQMRHLDLLSGLPKLNGIQVNPEPGRESPLEWLPEIRDMRRRGWCVYVICQSADEAVSVTRELGPDGLFIRIDGVRTAEEGERTIARIRAVC